MNRGTFKDAEIHSGGILFLKERERHMTHFVRKLILVCLPLLLLTAWTFPAQAASSHQAKVAPGPLCVIHSNPSMIEAGLGSTESSIADIIIVACRPTFRQDSVIIDATQLSKQCHGTLSWFIPSTPTPTPGPQFTVTLDKDGNATAVVFGGPSCTPTRVRIFARLLVSPSPIVSTTFTILPPQSTKPGMTASPKTEVEDATSLSIATVIRVEFPLSQARQTVAIKPNELFARCTGNLVWFGPEAVSLSAGDSVTVQLDNNSNAFVVAVGGPSCASGTSTITAELTTAPYTTFSTRFTILLPRPTI